MAQIASGGVNNAGIFVEDFSLTWLVNGTIPSGSTGKAVAWHTVANTVRLASGTIAATAGDPVGTGNFTIGSITVGTKAESGDYLVKFTAATAFGVFDPSGNLLVTGATGTAVATDHISFTITAGGTAAVAGDTMTITVVQADRVIGMLSSYEDRTVEGVKVGSVAHKGVFRFKYTGSAPSVGGTIGGSAATAGYVIALPKTPARADWPRVVAVDTTATEVTVVMF